MSSVWHEGETDRTNDLLAHDAHGGSLRGVEREAQVRDTECPHSPETPRTIQYDCACCGRQEIVKAESYGLRSRSTCQVIMQITIVEDGKVIDWGRAKIRVLARRGIGVPVTVLPEAKDGERPKFVGERIW